MGVTLYSCITPIAQMSRKRYYLRAKASGCCLLFSINQSCHRGQSRYDQIVAFSRSDNIKFLRYKFI